MSRHDETPTTQRPRGSDDDTPPVRHAATPPAQATPNGRRKGGTSGGMRGRATPPASLPPPTERWHDSEELRWAARHWATRIGVKTPRIQVRAMSSKWASISTAGRLTLNTDLLGVPKPLGEFVIVHELVHLLAPNHGRVFKSFLHAYLPDWPARERALKTYAAKPDQKK